MTKLRESAFLGPQEMGVQVAAICRTVSRLSADHITRAAVAIEVG